MKKRMALLVCLLSPLMYCNAQSRITGDVKSNNDSVVNYFNVALLNPNDSIVIKGGAFLDGHFELPDVRNGKYLLATSSLGYQTNYKVIELDNDHNLLDISILLNQLQLDEVKVRGRIPKVINKSDRYVVEVENTAISDAGNAVQALSRTPYVLVDPMTKKVSVAGRGSTLILINNRKITSDQELSILSSQNIKQIEVIENPSAKYDAEGQSVINIVTIKPKERGISASLRTLYTKGRHQSGQLNGDITYVTNKVVMFARYGYTNQKDEGFNSSHNRFQKEGYYFESMDREFENLFHTKGSDYAVGMNFMPASHHSIALKYEGYDNSTAGFTHKETDVLKNGTHLAPLTNLNDETQTYQRNGINFNYQFENKGYEISWISDYYKADHSRDNMLNEFYIEPEGGQKMKSNAHFLYDIFSSQLDVKIPLIKERIDMELGSRYSMVKNDNKNHFYHQESNQWIANNKFTSEVELDEQVTALYGILSYKLGKKIHMSAGGRYEKVKTKRSWNNEGQPELIMEDWFPSANISYVPSKNYSLRLSYSERIKRPSYRQLNNRVQYLNHYETRQGNPLLKPTEYKTLSLSTKLNKFNVSFTASYRQNPSDLMYINDPVQIEYTVCKYINMEDRCKYSMNLSRSFQYKFWSMRPFLSLSYMERILIEDGVKYTNNTPGVYFKWTNQFDLTKTTSLDADLLYSKATHSYKTFSDYYRFNLSLRQKMWQDKLTLQVAYQYIPTKWNQLLDYSYKLIDFTWDGDDRNMLTVSLRYNLSTTKKRFKSKSSNATELRRL
ncbi:TonB-dependent receptor [Halosquirtibacter xylanolyticus]|uniref:outer membrane beta-barrel family protein n=1 Tax=Halosquirtibacter xylanolyticus TaxID=3374599 RepID=UPI00374947E5|nr:TonB-dependent receptor [Prolixibacteraceae bacterium]